MGRILDISEVLLELGLSASATDEEKAIVSVCMTKAEGAIRRYLKYDPVQVSGRTEYYPRMDFSVEGRTRIWEVSDTDAFIRTLAEFSTEELQIQHLPIRAITNLFLDYDGRFGTRSGSFAADTELTEGVDFWAQYDGVDSSGNKICRDGIIRSEGRWSNVAGSVKIVYTSGYSDDELHGQDSLVDASPIWDAALDESIRRIKKSWSRRKHVLAGLGAGAFTSEHMGDYSYSADSAILDRLVGGGMDLLPETQHKLSEFVNWGITLSGG